MRRQFSLEEIQQAVDSSINYAEATRVIGIPDQTDVLKYWIKKYNINIAHFTKRPRPTFKILAKNCLRCNTQFLIKDTDYNKKRKYCSRECSNNSIESNLKRINSKQYHKIIKCKQCNNELHVKVTGHYTNLCENCKSKLPINNNMCIWCGEWSGTKRVHTKSCKKQKLHIHTLSYFGFNKSLIGSIKVFEEYERIKNLLKVEYYDNKLSLSALSEKYNLKDKGSIGTFLKKHFQFKLRDLSKAVINACETGRYTPSGSPKFKYKTGKHLTWDNKIFNYRSSYELDYYKKLDEQKIVYLVESLRLRYFDSVKNKERIAIPDIFIPDRNEIIEIKSKYTLDIQNMKDKVLEYKKRGYNFRFILDKKETVFT